MPRSRRASTRPGRRGASDGRTRVAMVINDLGAGGAQRAMLEQARALDPARFEVEIASLEFKPAADWAGRRAGAVALHRPGPLGLVPYLRAFHPHIVHAHLAAASLAAVLAARAAGRPRVMATCHNLTDWEEKRAHPVRILARGLMRDCHALVAVSEAVRDAIVRVRPELEDRVTVIHNGADLDPFAPQRLDRAGARARLGYAAGDFVAGSVARLDPRKGLTTLLEAAGRAAGELPGLRVLIVGDGPERGRLESRARVLGLEARVKFVGEQTDVRPFLAALDLFVAPSRTEGMGVAIVEALAAGVPVAGARVGGIPEVLEHGSAGWLIDGDDPAIWARAMVRAAVLPDYRERFIRAGLRRARDFSIDPVRLRLESVYERLAGGETKIELERAA